jgi:hypothetical protein
MGYPSANPAQLLQMAGNLPSSRNGRPHGMHDYSSQGGMTGLDPAAVDQLSHQLGGMFGRSATTSALPSGNSSLSRGPSGLSGNSAPEWARMGAPPPPGRSMMPPGGPAPSAVPARHMSHSPFTGPQLAASHPRTIGSVSAPMASVAPLHTALTSPGSAVSGLGEELRRQQTSVSDRLPWMPQV